MNYLLSGDDTLALRFRKRELIQEFFQEYPHGQLLAFDFSDGQIASLEKLEQELQPSFFNIPNILVIDGISTIYEGAKERVEYIVSIPGFTPLLFLEPRKILKADPFTKFAKKHLSEENYDLKKRDFSKYVNILQEDLGGNLDASTLACIQERSGKDDELALQNIQKVLTYTQGETLSKENLDVLVPPLLETKVFDALDALVTGRKEQALSLFHRILTEEDIFRIFPLCTWQIRQMLLVTEAKESFGENKEKIAKEAGIHPFVVQKLLRVLPQFPRSRLVRGLKMLAELDGDLKMSRKTPEGALQYFIFHW